MEIGQTMNERGLERSLVYGTDVVLLRLRFIHGNMLRYEGIKHAISETLELL